MTFGPRRAALAHARARFGPGLLLAFVIAAAAGFLSDHYGGPAMLFALLIGMAFNFLAAEPRFAPGVEFGARTLLRLGVAFLGARVTAADIAALGWRTALAVAALMALTIGAGFLAARLFGRGWRFGLLTGGAVAICGASAALALAAAIPPNDKLERNTLFTVISVTTLSTIAMIVYPILFSALDLTDTQIGFLIGATIHDVAQVIGAGYSVSDEAGDLAAIVKLMRVAMLPVVLLILLAALRGRGGSAASARPPGFVIGFAALAGLNSLGALPAPLVAGLAEASRWLLIAGISALGVKTSLKAMTEVGGGHAWVVVLETVFLAGLAVALVAGGLLTF